MSENKEPEISQDHLHTWTSENIKLPNGMVFSIVVCLVCNTYKKPLTSGNFKKEKE